MGLPKKVKTLEDKLKKALVLIWSRSSEHRQKKKELLGGLKEHTCPLCGRTFPDWGFDIDHNPPVGNIGHWGDTVDFIQRLFWGPQRLLCKTCNRALGAKQRVKKGIK